MYTIKREQKVSKVAREVKVGDIMQVSRYSFDEVVNIKRIGKIVYIKTANGKEIEFEHWMRAIVQTTYTITM